MRGLQRVCGPECAYRQVIADQAEKARKEAVRRLKSDKERIKSKAKWLSECQVQFNRWVRLRDGKAKLPCISCQRHHKGQYHAGHFQPVGGRSGAALRFEPDNCWRQCSACNNHLSGNLLPYRENLILLIGLERVEWLEGPHPITKYEIHQIKEIKQKYSKLANKLSKELDSYTP
jgi:hypothetical protein